MREGFCAGKGWREDAGTGSHAPAGFAKQTTPCPGRMAGGPAAGWKAMVIARVWEVGMELAMVWDVERELAMVWEVWS